MNSFHFDETFWRGGGGGSGLSAEANQKEKKKKKGPKGNMTIHIYTQTLAFQKKKK